VLIAAEANPGLPGDGAGPVFHEPWEARAFAMANALQESGLFSWEEWATALGEETRKAQAAGDTIATGSPRSSASSRRRE